MHTDVDNSLSVYDGRIHYNIILIQNLDMIISFAAKLSYRIWLKQGILLLQKLQQKNIHFQHSLIFSHLLYTFFPVPRSRPEMGFDSYAMLPNRKYAESTDSLLNI